MIAPHAFDKRTASRKAGKPWHGDRRGTIGSHRRGVFAHGLAEGARAEAEVDLGFGGVGD